MPESMDTQQRVKTVSERLVESMLHCAADCVLTGLMDAGAV